MIVRPEPRRGLFEDQFWKHVGEHRVHLQCCLECGTWWYPPAPVCPVCNGEDWRWSPVAGTGTVLSWVTFARTYFPSVPAPYTVVACRLDEGPIMLADTTADPDSLRIGQHMALRYYPVRTEDDTPVTLYRWSHDQAA